MPNPDVKLIATEPPPPQINGVPGPISLPKITPPVPPPPATIKPSPQMSGQTGYGVKTMIPPPDPYDKAQMPQPAPNPIPIEKTLSTETKSPLPLNPNLGLPPKPPAIKSYSYKPRTNSSRRLIIILTVLILLSATGFGVFYFIKKFNTPTNNNETAASLNLTPDQTALNNDNPSTKAAEFKKPIIAPDKGFGVLPPMDLSAFLLKDLKLKGTVIANEASPGDFAEKLPVYLKIFDPGTTAVSWFYSGVFKISSSSAQNLSDAEFLKKVESQQKSYYPTISPSKALENLVSADNVYGLSDMKTDWKKYILKSWQINDYGFVFYDSNLSVEKYIIPFYVFDGKAKLKGLVDGKLTDVTLKLFTPALSN